jgi:hypothetical protein
MSEGGGMLLGIHSPFGGRNGSVINAGFHGLPSGAAP